MHVVVLLWCSTDGTWRIPVAFRLWRPKRTCAPHPYQTKLQLAAGMLTEVVAARLPFQYLVMTPTTPPAGSPAWLAGCSSPGGDARPRTTVVWRGRRQQVATLARQLRLGWRPRLGLRAAAVRVYTPTHGMVGLVVTRNRHGNYDYLVTSDPAADLAPVVVRKQAGGRWRPSSGIPSRTPGWVPASAGRIRRWSATSPWSWSASSCCNSSAVTRPRAWLRSRNAGSWPSPAKGSSHQPRSRPPLLISGPPRKSCQ